MRTPAPVPPPATESFGSSPADSHPAMNLRISRGWSFGQGHCKAHDRESYGYQGLPKGSVRPITLGTWGFVARTYRNHVGTAALCPASVARRFHDQSSTPWWKVPLRAVRLCARSSCEQKYGQQEQQGLRSLRRIFQTMMLIDLILRESANESVVQVLGRLRDSGLGTPGIFRVGLLTSKILRPNYPWKASPYDLDSYHPSL